MGQDHLQPAGGQSAALDPLCYLAFVGHFFLSDELPAHQLEFFPFVIFRIELGFALLSRLRVEALLVLEYALVFKLILWPAHDVVLVILDEVCFVGCYGFVMTGPDFFLEVLEGCFGRPHSDRVLWVAVNLLLDLLSELERGPELSTLVRSDLSLCDLVCFLREFGEKSESTAGLGHNLDEEIPHVPLVFVVVLLKLDRLIMKLTWVKIDRFKVFEC